MQRDWRLRRPEDFRRLRERAPRSWATPLLVLYAAPNDAAACRVGVTVGKRVARSAVRRNRLRRRVREALRLRYPRLAPGHDLLLIARPASAGASWADLAAAVDTLLRRAGLWREAAAPAGSPA